MTIEFRHGLKMCLVVAAVSALSTPAMSAGGKPKGAQPTPPQEIISLYRGMTSTWNSGGSVYWAPDGTFQGINRRKDAVGVGKWFVTSKSKLCAEVTWNAVVAGKPKTLDDEQCWQFVTAPDGTIWERYLSGDDRKWYRHKREKQSKGNSRKRLFQKISAQLGL
ncbi:DUF995 domain-containing protein [Phaeobacter italicus]|uniref:DUF995 domain-containing protein n=1 Tax=Phaeobacter italicus TaxID=481446 RepID=UPI001C985446|nr:DUF995 domain-containing protein [Phaeobacter italicus]MBY6044825.1 DUF995 domain-containing protein [Phaeobacter italicus]